MATGETIRHLASLDSNYWTGGWVLFATQISYRPRGGPGTKHNNTLPQQFTVNWTQPGRATRETQGFGKASKLNIKVMVSFENGETEYNLLSTDLFNTGPTSILTRYFVMILLTVQK